ncbi:glycoside hydrolase domain-containing protein [Polyangium fumosum]|uniref:DUF1906 domain-containing protein n=1 Tax=Polyangium fumosum TaxID=889272 RepID=A0A4U1JFL9_9BACT|nr:glycoside hydrolase domain-containing protein [Polyangium fumosum]TKD09803.1 DUF1906 domain-containing protein [Polyangium fumosum]
MGSAGTVVRLPVGSVGIDRSATIAPQAAELFSLGYRFAIRNVGLPGGSTNGVLTESEAQTILGAGLALGLYQTYRNTGVTAAQGLTDGEFIADQAQSFGFPIGQGMALWCDLEGTFDVPAETLIQYLTNWTVAVTNLGYVPGLYNGPQSLLSASQVGALPFKAFWQAASLVPAVPDGYQMYQLNPANTMVAGINVDMDVVQQDFGGGWPTFWQG